MNFHSDFYGDYQVAQKATFCSLLILGEPDILHSNDAISSYLVDENFAITENSGDLTTLSNPMYRT